MMLITRGTRGDVQPFVALARGTLHELKRGPFIFQPVFCWGLFLEVEEMFLF